MWELCLSVGTGVLDGPEIELTKYGPIADKYIHQLHDFYEDLSIESMPNHIHIMLRVNGEENGPSRTPVPTVQNSIPSRFVSTFKRFCDKGGSENAVEGSFALCGDRPRLRALDVRRLLEKAGENFQKGVGRSFTSPFCRHYLRVKSSPFGE